MTLTALLRDPAGFEKECVIDWPMVTESMDEERGLAVYMFEDGNYACDCNRSMWLYGTPYDEGITCGSSIRCVSLKIGGEEIYSES